MTVKIETTYGAIRTATKHPFILIGVSRVWKPELAVVEIGEPFIEGYTRTFETAVKRAKRVENRRSVVIEVYEVRTGKRVR